MKRILPFPLLSMAIAIMWMLLTGFSSGHMLLAVIVGLTVPRVMLALKPAPPRIRFSMAMIRLFGVVLVDIIRSNYAVARIILTSPQERTAGFIRIPLDMENPYGLAVLSIIITATPGTLWVQHDMTRRTVLIHVFDLVDDAHWISLIKNRYERLLMEIFL